MNRFFTDKRIRWMLTALLALICIAGIYFPVVTVGDPLGFSEPENYSLTWFLSEAAFPEIYTVILIVYLATIGPLVVFSALPEMKKWALIPAAVGSVFFFGVNLFWGYIILSGGASAVSLTVWSWGYIGAQLLSIINIIAFIARFDKTSR